MTNIDLIDEWVNQETKWNNYHAIFKSWWVVGKVFGFRHIVTYPATNIKKPYHFMVVILYRLYGERNPMNFIESWVPIIQETTSIGVIFYQASILSTRLNWAIINERELETNSALELFMSSYLLDVFFSNNKFPGMS